MDKRLILESLPVSPNSTTFDSIIFFEGDKVILDLLREFWSGFEELLSEEAIFCTSELIFTRKYTQS